MSSPLSLSLSLSPPSFGRCCVSVSGLCLCVLLRYWFAAPSPPPPCCLCFGNMAVRFVCAPRDTAEQIRKPVARDSTTFKRTCRSVGGGS